MEKKQTDYRDVLIQTKDGETKEFTKLMKIMGKCIKAGGAVNMTTRYSALTDFDLYMNLTLEWPNAKT